MQDFHLLTTAWFTRRFAGAPEPQLEAWPEIRTGRDVLISAPTGSGKTLAAFLICLDRLIWRAAGGDSLEDRTEVVYVSPLKALSNDIQKNLDGPLAEIRTLAAEQGLALSPIRTGLRTGDTPTWEREKMARRPPHVLVTTPESLFILLTAESGDGRRSSARGRSSSTRSTPSSTTSGERISRSRLPVSMISFAKPEVIGPSA